MEKDHDIIEEEALVAEQQAPAISSASSTTSSTITIRPNEESSPSIPESQAELPTSLLLDFDLLNTEDWLNRALGLAP